MYKLFNFPTWVYSVKSSYDGQAVVDAVTGRELERVGCEDTVLPHTQGGHVNGVLKAYTYKSLMGVVVKVYVLAYQKNNRLTRRGHGLWEYKVLNITGKYE